MKQQKKCIFCANTGMSKEHFWPNWLREYLSISDNDKHKSELRTSRGKKPYIITKHSERSGNLITKKFRVVCELCNNGWMGTIEEQVKPLLISILKSECSSICIQELVSLAQWCALKIMVTEHSEDGTQVTPENDRKEFFKNRTIPPYFRIFISRYKSLNASWYYRTSCTLAKNKSGPTPALNGMKRNTQSITFIVGELFVHVFAARVDELYFPVEAAFEKKMVEIYPKVAKECFWKELESLTDIEARSIVYALDSITFSRQVKYGGDLPISG